MTTSAAFRRQGKKEPMTWKQVRILSVIGAVLAAIIGAEVWLFTLIRG